MHQTKNCSQNKNAAEKILDNYLKDLSNKVNKKLGKSTSTQTASSGSSSTSLSSWTDTKLCIHSTFLGNSNKKTYWRTNINAQNYVQEAKRRGLSCGVGGSTQTASSGSSSNTNNSLALQHANQKAHQAQTEAQQAKSEAQQLKHQLAQLQSQQACSFIDNQALRQLALMTHQNIKRYERE